MTTDNNDTIDKTFVDDDLGRLEFAKNLVSIIEKENKGYVLALDSAWGGGKTHFCHMFKNALNDGYKEEILKGNKCLYFDAWENDFSEEPLVNFIGEILKKENNIDAELAKTLKSSTINFIKTALPIAVKGGASYWLGRIFGKETIDELRDGVSDLSDSLIENVLSEDINKYQDTKDTIRKFKSSLQKIAPDGKKLVIFIDELDRCRPDYAIKLLEHIKYIFRTENVFFILSINRDELANSIQSVYGNIDAKAYLKRFVDYVVALPEPDHEKYVRVLFEKAFGQLPLSETSNDNRREVLEKTIINDAVIAFSAITAFCDFTIRDIEQTFKELEFVFTGFNQQTHLQYSLGYLSIFLTMKNQTIYHDYDIFKKDRINYESLKELYCQTHNINNLNEMDGKQKIHILRSEIGKTDWTSLFFFCPTYKEGDDEVIHNSEDQQTQYWNHVEDETTHIDTIKVKRILWSKDTDTIKYIKNKIQLLKSDYSQIVFERESKMKDIEII